MSSFQLSDILSTFSLTNTPFQAGHDNFQATSKVGREQIVLLNINYDLFLLFFEISYTPLKKFYCWQFHSHPPNLHISVYPLGFPED